MINVEEVKRVIKENSELFGSTNGDSRRYEAKLWYLTGILNGILYGKNCLNGGEFAEVSNYINKLLEEN